MKKRIIGLITAVTLLLCACVFAVIGCSDEEKVTYSVTVLGVDENPVQGVTVNLQSGGKTHGSGVTNADGEAKINLVAGNYTVTLGGIDAGLTYPQVTLSSATRETRLPLSVAKIKYSATVLDKDGAAAKNVTVTWNNGTAIAGTAVTGDDGNAECELDYGDYTVTVSNLPVNNIFTDAISVTGANPKVQFELRAGQSVAYSVTVRSEGGFKFANTDVFVYNSNKLPIHSGKTDKNGVLGFSLPADSYTVGLPDVSVQEGYTVVSTGALSDGNRNTEIVLHSEVITTPAASDKKYVTGDIINDFSFTTPYNVNGAPKTYTISELLKTYKAVVINNWGTKCSWCVREMPAMDGAYGKLNDKLELLAISNYNGGDTNSEIIDFRETNGYSFPMMRDGAGFASHFDFDGWPSTVIIDRYGAIAHIESGAVEDQETWEKLFGKFVADDYEQTFVAGERVSESIKVELARPTVTVPDGHYEKVAEAINGDNADIVWRGETEWEMAWPFILKTEEGVSEDKQVLCSSNSGTPNTISILYGTVTMPAGKVLAFDYYSDTEEDGDVLSVVLDNSMVLREISGDSDGWKTCYLYSELVQGEHEIALSYVKNSTGNVGKDNVYIRNVRFEEISAITEPTDMLRAAAYGGLQADGIKYNKYAGVEMGEDNYYHVKLSTLQNSDKAGLDQSPMLFANMLSVTNWSRSSVNQLVVQTNGDDGDYTYSCEFTINGEKRDYRADIIEYCRIASASDVYGCVPVDKELHDLLVAFMAVVSGSNSHAEEWLEACYFYSHYGSDDGFIGNPIIGVSTKTAIPMTVDTVYSANLTRNMYPFPTEIYTFTPTESAVYKIESLIPASLAARQSAQVWLFDDNTDTIAYCGDTRLVRDGQNEHNFELYHYLTAEHKYYIEVAFQMADAGDLEFKISNVGQSATELMPCSDNFFSSVDGSLMGAVSYYKDDEGYYRVGDEENKHADDPYIYVDVNYPTVLTNISLRALVEQNLRVPIVNVDCGYKTFDFRKTIEYSFVTDGDDYISYYDTECDLVEFMQNVVASDPDSVRTPDMYIDYTQIMLDYIANAETGENEGLIKVNDELVNILTLFIEVRVNAVWDGRYTVALENEWLRLCWYYHTYTAPTEVGE